jgi:hypothetical protein
MQVFLKGKLQATSGEAQFAALQRGYAGQSDQRRGPA